MQRLGLRVPSVIVQVPVCVVRVVVVVPPPPHLRRRHRALDAGHRLQHPLQRVAVQAHAVLPVHVLGALRLASSRVRHVVVEHVVVVGVASHLHVRVVHRLGVGEHVVLAQLRPG